MEYYKIFIARKNKETDEQWFQKFIMIPLRIDKDKKRAYFNEQIKYMNSNNNDWRQPAGHKRIANEVITTKHHVSKLPQIMNKMTVPTIRLIPELYNDLQFLKYRMTIRGSLEDARPVINPFTFYEHKFITSKEDNKTIIGVELEKQYAIQFLMENIMSKSDLENLKFYDEMLLQCLVVH